MKTITLAILLFCTSFVFASTPTQDECYVTSGIPVAVIMEKMEDILINSTENLFRTITDASDFKSEITYTQKANMKIVLKDVYNTRVRPLYRKKLLSADVSEILAILEAMENDDVKHKGFEINLAIVEETFKETKTDIYKDASMFMMGCMGINRGLTEDGYLKQKDTEK